MHRLGLILALALSLICACSSGTTEDDGGVCIPGQVKQCICYATGGAGFKQCQLTKEWSGCDCSGDITPASADAGIIVGADTGGGKPPVGPGESPPGGAVEGSGGGIGLESENYKLRLFVAPARPVGQLESEKYRLRLGPHQGL
jgi:hypothetical protein